MDERVTPRDRLNRTYDRGGRDLVLKRWRDTPDGSELGPFGEVIPTDCATTEGFGAWTPTYAPCHRCSASGWCMARTLQLEPQEVWVRPHGQLRRRKKDPNPFNAETQEHRVWDAFIDLVCSDRRRSDVEVILPDPGPDGWIPTDSMVLLDTLVWIHSRSVDHRRADMELVVRYQQATTLKRPTAFKPHHVLIWTPKTLKDVMRHPGYIDNTDA